MAEYTLNIHIDQEHVKHFNTSGYKLCVASGVQSGGDLNFNVVAFSSREHLLALPHAARDTDHHLPI